MRSRSLLLVFVAVFILFQAVACVYAGDFLALQGNVKQGGVDLASGNLRVLIYDAAFGGNLIYNSSNDFNNAIANGKYDVLLGNTSQELNLRYGQKYYFEIYVSGEKLNYSNGMGRQVFQSAVGNISSAYLNLSGGAYVPYQGASQNVDLGNNNFTVNNSFYVVLGSGTGTANKVLSVGIGTSNPVTQLEIVNERNSAQGGANRHLTLTNNIGNLSAGPQINFRKSAGTYLSPFIVIDGQTLGNINFQGYNGSDYNVVSMIAFNVNTTGTNSNVTGSNIPVDILFNSVPDGTFSTSEGTKMIIKSNGKIGIGTDSPSNYFTVYSKGGGFERGIAITHESNNAGSPVIWFKKAHGAVGGLSNIVRSEDVLGAFYTNPWNGSEYPINMLNSGIWFGVNISGQETVINGTYIPSDIVFGTDPNGWAQDTPRMIITSTGKVGIGTSSPTENLVVDGADKYGVANITATLKMDNCTGADNQTKYSCAFGETSSCTDTYVMEGYNYTREVTCSGIGNAIISGHLNLGGGAGQGIYFYNTTQDWDGTRIFKGTSGQMRIDSGDGNLYINSANNGLFIIQNSSGTGDENNQLVFDPATGNLTITGDFAAANFPGTGGGNSSFNQTLTDGIYVPYTSAIGNVDLNGKNLTTSGIGEFGPVTNYQASLGESYAAGFFRDPAWFNQVYLVDGTYALNVIGNSRFQGDTNITGKLIVGNNADFNGGWLNGGVTIDDGNIFAKAGYFYNITSLTVNNMDVNGTIYPGFNNTFDIGSADLMWRNGYFSGNLNVGGDVFINGQNITGNYVPYSGATKNVDLNGKNLSTNGIGEFGSNYEVTLGHNAVAGFFRDSGWFRQVYLADGTYAIKALGNSYFNGDVNITGNATAAYFIGSGRYLTDLPAGGNLSFNQTLTDGRYVPYTNANQNVNLGNYNITAKNVNVTEAVYVKGSLAIENNGTDLCFGGCV